VIDTIEFAIRMWLFTIGWGAAFMAMMAIYVGIQIWWKR